MSMHIKQGFYYLLYHNFTLILKNQNYIILDLHNFLILLNYLLNFPINIFIYRDQNSLINKNILLNTLF
jgi:hypothetical protein